jgi:hypothetical protein
VKKLACLLVLAAASFAPPSARAWGCRGHQIIALIAWRHLTPSAARQVNRILASGSFAAIRGCPKDGLPLIAAVASWPDGQRQNSQEHYINIPPVAKRTTDYCHGDCVTDAIAKYTRELRNHEDAAVALAYIIHLVGDVHQPLHAFDDNDRGANCVETRLPHSRRKVSLHADWDTALLPPGNAVVLARSLDDTYSRHLALGSTSPDDWAWESHILAEQYAYGPLHLSSGCDPAPVELSPAYVERAQPVIDRQLVLAGERLARLLNQIL